ncbi:MAG: lyase family protein, partial [Acidimicrobiia bacterium]
MTENVLATRYASPEMRHIWDLANKIRLERHLWVTVLETQQRLGLEVPEGAVEAYRAGIDRLDLDAIERRERSLRHDVKARIEEFNAIAGYESIHLGMTSRDVTENVELLQIRQSLDLVMTEAVAALGAMAALAVEQSGVAITARTHNVPAQVTTVGKRVASAGEELAMAVERAEMLAARLPLRGIKGPVGTQQDQVELLGSGEAAAALDEAVAQALGFDGLAGSVGQVYPRSLDLDIVSCLVQLGAGPANFTTTLRLMAGHDLATEGFLPGQVGSSAMP